MDEAQKQNIFRHILTEKCVSKTSELTEKQLSVQTENKMAGGKASNKISKLCTSQATKNVLVDGSAEPVGAYWDGEKANG